MLPPLIPGIANDYTARCLVRASQRSALARSARQGASVPQLLSVEVNHCVTCVPAYFFRDDDCVEGYRKLSDTASASYAGSPRRTEAETGKSGHSFSLRAIKCVRL